MVIESSEVQGSESIFLFGVHQLPSPGQNLLYGSTELERLLEMEEVISGVTNVHVSPGGADNSNGPLKATK